MATPLLIQMQQNSYVEHSDILGYYAACSDDFLPMLRDN